MENFTNSNTQLKSTASLATVSKFKFHQHSHYIFPLPKEHFSATGNSALVLECVVCSILEK